MSSGPSRVESTSLCAEIRVFRDEQASLHLLNTPGESPVRFGVVEVTLASLSDVVRDLDEVQWDHRAVDGYLHVRRDHGPMKAVD